VTEEAVNPHAGESASRPRATAGALLRAAREAGGLSVDAVAQQLKLAPRQVTALEEDDYTHLPGRTFVRGFVRNYARFLRLDVGTVLGALPAGAAVPALAAPTLQQTAPTMGELPVTDHARPVPAGHSADLAAIVAAAALYEWLRPAVTANLSSAGHRRRRASGHCRACPRRQAVPTAEPATCPPSATAAEVASPAVAATQTAVGSAPATLAASKSIEAPAREGIAGAAAAPGPGDAQLVLQFRDFSWTEVKDRDGRVLMSSMNPGGTTQAVSGAPPFEIVIGNASDVRATFRGQPVDLVPHTRQNVARFTLP
jgi:cytoskeleton protein RodZ